LHSWPGTDDQDQALASFVRNGSHRFLASDAPIPGFQSPPIPAISTWWNNADLEGDSTGKYFPGPATSEHTLDIFQQKRPYCEITIPGPLQTTPASWPEIQ